MAKVELTMRHDRSTKGTHVFKRVDNEDGTQPPVETLYIEKSGFEGGKAPATIRVTYEYGAS